MLAVGLVGSIALLVATSLRYEAKASAFSEIEKGASISQVVAMLGEPDEIRACSDFLFWEGDHKPLGPSDDQCENEYYYSWIMGGWSVSFDKSSEVIAKYEYCSP